MLVLEGRRGTDHQLELVNQEYIQESPRFLICGVVLGILGFTIAVVPYVLRLLEFAFRGSDIPRKEVPATVSELVSNWSTVEARIFFGFELTAAIMIMLSWYPYKLRSACCIPAAGGCRLTVPLGCVDVSMYWATFRQFVPPIGLILVACCPTVPPNVARLQDVVLIATHCGAAMMMFVGFLLAESHALCVGPLRCTRPSLEKDTAEYRERLAMLMLSGMCFGLFLFLQVLGGVYIIDFSQSRLWSIVSFISEVVSGLAMLVNHGTIWYYAPERKWSQRGCVGDWSQAVVQPHTEVELCRTSLASTNETVEPGAAGEGPGGDA